MEKVSNFDSSNLDVCCCCLINGCAKDIWSQYTWMGEQEVFGTMLKSCFNLTLQKYDGVQNDRICDTCVMQLRNAHAFKEQVEDCQRKLQEFHNGTGALYIVIDDTSPTKKLKIEESDIEDSKEAILESKWPILDDTESQLSDDFVQDFDVKLENIQSQKCDDVKRRADKRTRSTGKIPKREKCNSSKVRSTRTKRNIKLSRKQRKAPLKENIGLILEYSSICPFKTSRGHFNCFYCNKPFVVFGELREHTENDHKDINSSEIRNSIVRKHGRPVKADVSNIICKICNENQPSLKHFIDHLPEHDKNFDLGAKTEPIDCILGYIMNNGRYGCGVCKMEFQFFRSLSRHMNDHGFDYACDVCDKRFLFPVSLGVHRKLHDNLNLKCDQCNKRFGSSVLLRSHIRYAHTDKKFMCSICDRSFKSYRLRTEHLVEVHNSKRPEFKCEVCSKNFCATASLRYHVRSEHLNIKRQPVYVCERCGKSFITKNLLKCHVRWHTRDGKHECEFCRKKYTRAKTLNEHRLIHLNDRRFSCLACGQSFVQNASLKYHIRAHHPDKNVEELFVCKKSP